MTTIEILAIAAHPDDIEITCGGFMIRMADLGYTTGILDLTRGEMGTKGSPETRANEVSLLSRNTQGVRLIELAEGERVVGVARLAEKEEDDGNANGGDAESA